MRIARVGARWLHAPIPPERQHVSDFGRVASFDMALIHVESDDGQIGWGEAKAAVGSAGACAAIVAIIEHELGPALIGCDPRRVTALWELMYNGTRERHAARAGRAMPILGRRGLTVSAISGIDMALWDMLGRLFDAPVLELWGGARHDRLPAYASGGWADATAIGKQLGGYVDAGFAAVKMRVGVMDGDVATSVARVRAARESLGDAIELMVDAHGTFAPLDAIAFARAVEPYRIRWFEEPVSADDRAGGARVRAAVNVPIAAGESEYTRFDFVDLVERGSADVLQPDLAICGGPTEGRRVAALAESHQLELAPHCWGSALSFAAGASLAFASPAARVIEYSLGANPFLHELFGAVHVPVDGSLAPPSSPGFGCDPVPDIVDRYTVGAASVSNSTGGTQ
jgi:L-alanine-DL-glutamate epimerase-like enolase superfamily enzyme